MNNLAMVEPGSHHALWIDQPIHRPFEDQGEWLSGARINSVSVALGDSPYGSAIATGGILPESALLSPIGSATTTTVLRAASYLSPVLVSRESLGEFVTSHTMSWAGAAAAFQFSIYVVCRTRDTEPRFIRAVGEIHRRILGMERSRTTAVTVRRPATGRTRASRDDIGPVLSEIRQTLSEWSESRLASLFGVSRQTWRAWARQDSRPRPRHRANIRLLRHILRAVLDGGRSASWFEEPLWPERADTPELLFQQGRAEILPALALRAQRRPLARVLEGQIDIARATERLLEAASVRAVTPDER
jgi:DNA-binding transcriptional regulator YiaG